MDRWLEERGSDPFSPTRKAGPRNDHWHHMYNGDIISMPDKWEYPWYAAWDLAFHVIALTLVDPDFGKQQLKLMVAERYMHPNGQIPAYEWNFGDVNPPVHAWSTIFTYLMETAQKGQVRSQLTWVESMLSDGRRYLLGEAPALADFAVYNPIWFIRQHLGAQPEILAPFPHLAQWADRVQSFGNGSPEELSGQDALAVARAANLRSAEDIDPYDPAGLKAGAAITVCPDDTGRDPVAGTLVSSSAHEVVLRRSDRAAGEVLVHFPRAGFVVSPA